MIRHRINCSQVSSHRRGMKDKKIPIEAKSGKVCWRQGGGGGGARVLYRPRYARTSAAATN